MNRLREDVRVVNIDRCESGTLEQELVADVVDLRLKSGGLGVQVLDTDRAETFCDANTDNLELKVAKNVSRMIADD